MDGFFSYLVKLNEPDFLRKVIKNDMIIQKNPLIPYLSTKY